MPTATLGTEADPAVHPAGATLISVIIPASRPVLLERCLESLARASGQDSGPDAIEFLVILNGGGNACAETATRWQTRLLGLRVLDGAPRMPGAARNRALPEARGEWLCFLDDDVTVPPYYFSALRRTLTRYPQASVVGGPNLTHPGRPLFERCVGHFLGSCLGAGGTRRRFCGYPRDSWTDERGLILCNLCIRSEALRREDLRFDESLPRNEENLLLERLLRRGHRALHSPGLYVYHERRANLASFSSQCNLSGRGRAGMTWKLPASLRPIYLMPALLGLCLLGAPLFPASLGLLSAAYAAAALANALWLTLRRREPARAVFWLWLLHPAAHLSYAAGFLRGLLKRPAGS